MSSTDTFVKSSFGWLEMKNYSADPTDVDTTRVGLAVVAGALKLYSSSAWAAVSGSSGIATTFDEIYANDADMTVSSGSFTLNGTADVDVMTINGNADVDAGALLQFASTGDAKDIQGTSDTWNVSKTGYFTGVRAFISGYISTASATDLVLHTNSASNSSSITITDAANGDITLGMNGTGMVVISGTTETNPALTVSNGDVVVSDGSLSITDDDVAASLTVTNTAAVTTGLGVVTVVADSATTGNIFDVNGDAMTSGSVIHLDVTGATFTGEYIDCTDGGTSEFKVMRYGATTIRGAAAGTDAFTVSLGDLEITDSDTNEISSVNGTGTLLTLDNEGGAIGAAASILKLDSGGVMDAAAYGLHIVFNGANTAGTTMVYLEPDAGSVGMYIDGATTATREALKVDADTTGNYHVVSFHSDSVLASGYGVLNVDTGGALASGAHLVKFDLGAGIPNAAAIPILIDAAAFTGTTKPTIMKIDAGSKDGQALLIDADPTTKDVVGINCDSIIAADKGALQIITTGSIAAGGTAMRFDITGTPDADARILEFDMAGVTDTNEPYVIFIDSGGKKTRALYIDADPVTNDVAYIHSDAVIADNKALLSLHSAGAIASGANVFRITTAGTPDAGSIIFEMDVQDDAQAIYIDSDSATNHAVHIIGSGDLGDNKAMLCVESNATALAAGSALVRIQDSGSAAGAGATCHGLVINMDGTNLEGLWVEKGTSTFAEAITVSAGGAAITGTSSVDGAFTVNDSSADVDFRVETDSSEYGLEVNGGNNNVSINATGISAHYDLALLGDGTLCMKETTTPTADTNYGKVYCKNDNKLYFQDGAGTEYTVTIV